MNSHWYAPEPSEAGMSRLSLDFGLRRADLHFRNLVVPGLGRIWFARQLSWPLAALALHKDLRVRPDAPKPTAICHAIEALACKLHYREETDERSNRILGRRAFGRDAEQQLWSFRALRQVRNYVRNTHRQAATRAIRVDGGLGFVSGLRFDLLQLEPPGVALADAFLEQRVGQGGTSLRRWLEEWLLDRANIPHQPQTLLKALSPEYITDGERSLIHARLFDSSDAGTQAAANQRQHLAEAIGRAAALPSIENTVVARLRGAGRQKQADEILTALAFGALLDGTRNVISRLTHVVEPARSVSLVNIIRDQAIVNALAALRTSARNYMGKAAQTEGVQEHTSQAFAKSIIDADGTAAIRILVQRSGEILSIADNALARGTLFRIIGVTAETDGREEGAASVEPDSTGRTFRITNFHSLLRDIDPRTAR